MSSLAKPYIDQVERNADPQWLEDAYNALVFVAAHNKKFIADDIWYELEARNIKSPREPRALGPVIRRAQRTNIIRATSEFRPSNRRHSTPIRVWQLI